MAADHNLIETIQRLKAEGVTRVTFHADGTIASAEFGPTPMQPTDRQNETPKDPASTYPRRPVGSLVTRGDGSSA